VGAAMYIVIGGMVEAFGKESKVLYASMGTGCYFGELSLLDTETRSASVRARHISDLRVLSKDDFDRCDILLRCVESLTVFIV
jgi:CRP-like cAMP-binding protein